MAYHDQKNSYGHNINGHNGHNGPRTTYAGPTNHAGHFPQSHQHQHHPQHQQQSHFYPNPYPQSNHSNHSNQSNQSNGPSPPLPSSSYIHPQPSSEGQTYQPQRQQYGPNQIQMQVQNHNAGGPLMQPPTSLPDDHFKKPYLPQHQYMNHGRLLFPLEFAVSYVLA